MATAEEFWKVLCRGLEEFVTETACDDVVIGLSGGIDSAVVTCMAVEVLGKEHVEAIAMPSRYSSDHSLADAAGLAKRLDIRLHNLPIGQPLVAFEGLLKEQGYTVEGVTLENLQARIRAVILMAHANERNALVLNTGNRSEALMGYCTLYGDSIGAIAPLGNVLKTDVYKLARYINAPRYDFRGDPAHGAAWIGEPRIPQNILTKTPSAELRPKQKDMDDLPPYGTLDAILRRWDEGLLADGGHDELTQDVLKRIRAAVFKQLQCTPALGAPRYISDGTIR